MFKCVCWLRIYRIYIFYTYLYIYLYICIIVFGIVGNFISISLSVHTNWKIGIKVDFDFDTLSSSKTPNYSIRISRYTKQEVDDSSPVSHQRTDPGFREAAQFVPAHIEQDQGLQTVQDCCGQAAETIIRHIQLLQLTQTNPVSGWHRRKTEHSRSENQPWNWKAFQLLPLEIVWISIEMVIVTIMEHIWQPPFIWHDVFT